MGKFKGKMSGSELSWGEMYVKPQLSSRVGLLDMIDASLWRKLFQLVQLYIQREASVLLVDVLSSNSKV